MCGCCLAAVPLELWKKRCQSCCWRCVEHWPCVRINMRKRGIWRWNIVKSDPWLMNEGKQHKVDVLDMYFSVMFWSQESIAKRVWAPVIRQLSHSVPPPLTTFWCFTNTPVPFMCGGGGWLRAPCRNSHIKCAISLKFSCQKCFSNLLVSKITMHVWCVYQSITMLLNSCDRCWYYELYFW